MKVVSSGLRIDPYAINEAHKEVLSRCSLQGRGTGSGRPSRSKNRGRGSHLAHSRRLQWNPCNDKQGKSG